MRRLVFIILVFSTIAYLIVGSVVFHYLEDGAESKQKKSLAKAHADFLAHHPTANATELRELIMTAVTTHLDINAISAVLNRSITGNASSLEDDSVITSSKWDIASGFLFCITVISTIGYGNMVPRTWGGQLFCIFYALFGIPIFGAVLVGTGERLQIPIKKLHQCRPWVKDNPIKDQKLKSILLLSTGMSVIVFIPALVFTITEDWSYLEGMYYSVITLTTVGFGDLVPGQGLEEFLIPKGATATRHYFYRIVLSLWIIMGLSWIALILSEISTLMQSQMNNVAASTSHRLSNLEELVRKKAKETRDRFSKKDFCQEMYQLTHIKAFQIHAKSCDIQDKQRLDKLRSQTTNTMVMNIAINSHAFENPDVDDDAENNDTTDSASTDLSNNNINSTSAIAISCEDSSAMGSEDTDAKVNGTSLLGDHNGHALPITEEFPLPAVQT